MKKTIFFLLITIYCSISYAQEGRPALGTETAENQRVKTIIRDAFPHDLTDWEMEDESKVDGETWFHDGGMAVKYPFSHDFKIRYVRKNVSDNEREKWQKIAIDAAGIQKMIDESECEIVVSINTFRVEFTSKSLQTKAISPFNLALVAQHGSKLFIGNGWKMIKNEDLGDGRRSYVVEASINKAIPMTQIQTVQFASKSSPTVLDFFLKNINLKAIQALIGQNKISQTTVSNPISTEKPLTKPIEGNNEIVFTLNGGDFSNRSFKLKHSKESEFGYLRNNHPNPAVTENAITRILIQEDDDFATKNKTGFLDITIPFIRQTGQFEVFNGSEKASFVAGINCWDGCEYSFNAENMKINITRYDAVGGFIEGAFEGEVKVGYKLNQPLDTDKQKRPNAQIKGKFKVHRKEDRY